MRILLTGCAGFIGAAVSQALLEANHEVVGIDNLNDYYPVSLKQARLDRLLKYPQFHFSQVDIHVAKPLFDVFAKHRPQRVVHLAAQAGVRFSLENPHAYVDSNLAGFVNILEAARQCQTEHLVFASSSSVYGANTKFPYSVHDAADHPLSLYAATKKANELMAHAYSHLYQLPVTGLRYFTVYGPWGRPDMAPYKFARAISQGEPITVFNQGQHQRDFTFISDIAAGTIKVLETVPQPASEWLPEKPDPATSNAPYRIYNIGCGRPVELLYFISLLEENLGKKARLQFQSRQAGDVDMTWADITDLETNVGYRAQVTLEEGIPQFVQWYKAFYE